MSNSDWGDTPLLEQVIQTCVDGAMEGLRTSLPGQVLSYDKDSNRATVQVQVQESVIGESGKRVTKTVTIPDVPVAALGWGTVRIKIPVTKGSQCWLSFSSSCLTAWKQSGRLSDPKDDRRHHDADVIVQPWMSVASKDDEAMIEFTDSGEIHAGGDDPVVRRSEFLSHGHPVIATGAVSPTAGPVAGALPAGSSGLFPGTAKLRG